MSHFEDVLFPLFCNFWLSSYEFITFFDIRDIELFSFVLQIFFIICTLPFSFINGVFFLCVSVWVCVVCLFLCGILVFLKNISLTSHNEVCQHRAALTKRVGDMMVHSSVPLLTANPYEASQKLWGPLEHHLTATALVSNKMCFF